jgi:hypothetical protein
MNVAYELVYYYKDCTLKHYKAQDTHGSRCSIRYVDGIMIDADAYNQILAEYKLLEPNVRPVLINR